MLEFLLNGTRPLGDINRQINAIAKLLIGAKIMPKQLIKEEYGLLFIAFSKLKAGFTMQERLSHRVKWTYPEGLKVIAEYWLHTTNPYSIVVFEADDIAPIMLFYAAWEDMLDITVVPAITAEEGLKCAEQMMAG